MKKRSLKQALETRRERLAAELDGGRLQRRQFDCEVGINKDTDSEESRTLRFTISTNRVDRHGDTVNPDGWDLRAFKKNPVVLFAHDHTSLPVARASNIKTENGALVADATFPGPELYPFANTVFEMYKQGFLNATSVGFKPLKYKFIDEEDEGFDVDDDGVITNGRGWLAVDFVEQELLEYSAVPIPANPEALQLAKDSGIDIRELHGWAERVLDTWALQQETGLAVPRDKVEELHRWVRSIEASPSKGTKLTPEEGEARVDKSTDKPKKKPKKKPGKKEGITREDAIEEMRMLLSGEVLDTELNELYAETCEHYKELGMQPPERRFAEAAVLLHLPDVYTLNEETGGLERIQEPPLEEATDPNDLEFEDTPPKEKKAEEPTTAEDDGGEEEEPPAPATAQKLELGPEFIKNLTESIVTQVNSVLSEQTETIKALQERIDTLEGTVSEKDQEPSSEELIKAVTSELERQIRKARGISVE